MVGLGRLELPTSPLSGARSSHLSYRPNEEANAATNNGSMISAAARRGQGAAQNSADVTTGTISNSTKSSHCRVHSLKISARAASMIW
jgi:hypothetical protein